MKLSYSPTSPYVRKVLMVAHEKGVADQVMTERIDPWASDPSFTQLNPVSKVPALTLDDGTTLFDSCVICEYLDSLGSGPAMFPPPGKARWQALRLQALGDAICDAALLRRQEMARPTEQQSSSWIERQRLAISRSLDMLEAEAGQLGDQPTIGTLAVLMALGYLDLRFSQDSWRTTRPALANWFDRASKRDSFGRTAPPPQ